MSQQDDPTPLDLTDSSAWPELLTVDEAAHVLRTNTRMIFIWIREGNLPSVGGARLARIPKAALINAVATAHTPPVNTEDQHHEGDTDGPDRG